MRKITTVLVFVLAVVLAIGFVACGKKAQPTIKIGVNAPITGDIPKVGEGTRFAAQMWLEHIQGPAACRWATPSTR
jgi:branched-chain amino acid transport system substrate-binding protein